MRPIAGSRPCRGKLTFTGDLFLHLSIYRFVEDHSVTPRFSVWPKMVHIMVAWG